jgi:hypothetical protein
MTTIVAPPAPTPAPPPLTPGGRGLLRALVVVIAVVLVGGSVLALGVTAFGVSRFRVVAEQKALPADIRALVVDASQVPAAVKLTTDRDATEPKVSMRMVDAAQTDDQTMAITRDGTKATVTVNGQTPGFLRWARMGEVTVTLPPALARNLSVMVQQDAGLLLAQADLDELIAHGNEGVMVLSGSARRIEVHNENGDVVTREPISVAESFTAITVDGHISVDFKDVAPRTIEANSSNGDVALELPPAGPYLVHADSRWSTNVRVPETSDPARAAAEVTARSQDGAVSVSAPGADRNAQHHP